MTKDGKSGFCAQNFLLRRFQSDPPAKEDAYGAVTQDPCRPDRSKTKIAKKRVRNPTQMFSNKNIFLNKDLPQIRPS